MHLLRYGPKGAEKPGLLYPSPEGSIRDLSGLIPDIGPEALGDDTLERLRALDPTTLPLVRGRPRVAPCIAAARIIANGLNYTDHAAELGIPVPGEPVPTLRSATVLCGPEDDLVLPAEGIRVDWGCELGVVIGRTARNVDEDAALRHVAGYCVVNDIVNRSPRSATGGGGRDDATFAAATLGPWLVTRDAIAEPQTLGIWSSVNGRRCQDSSTALMVFEVPYLVHRISMVLPLEPGDVIATGTPAGVGAGQEPPLFLKPGDLLRAGIEGLGEQVQRVVRPE